MVMLLHDEYFIIEAKVSSSTEQAIEQIQKKYLPQMPNDRPITMIGINWDKEGGKVEVRSQK